MDPLADAVQGAQRRPQRRVQAWKTVHEQTLGVEHFLGMGLTVIS